jgi:hypothetical protein
LAVVLVLDRYIAGAQGYTTGPVGYYPSVYKFSSTGNLGITATGALFDPTTDESVGTVALDYLLEDVSIVLMTAAATANAGGQVLWAYVVEREGVDAGKIVGTTTGDSMTIDSVRVNAINMADVHVASSATFLRERGWPAEYFVGTEITGVTFEGISTIIGTEVGLNWLLVTGQNNTCNPGHIWRDGLCWKCENGFQPKEHIVGAPDECMPCGVSQAGMHGHCKQNGSRFGGSGGSLYIPTP